MEIVRNIIFLISLIIVIWFGIVIVAELIRGQAIAGLQIFLTAIAIASVVAYFVGIY